ncbi:MAG: hypothetical protein V9F82_01815 [Dermatophilaceae bacterium]
MGANGPTQSRALQLVANRLEHCSGADLVKELRATIDIARRLPTGTPQSKAQLRHSNLIIRELRRRRGRVLVLARRDQLLASTLATRSEPGGGPPRQARESGGAAAAHDARPEASG